MRQTANLFHDGFACGLGRGDFIGERAVHVVQARELPFQEVQRPVLGAAEFPNQVIRALRQSAQGRGDVPQCRVGFRKLPIRFHSALEKPDAADHDIVKSGRALLEAAPHQFFAAPNPVIDALHQLRAEWPGKLRLLALLWIVFAGFLRLYVKQGLKRVIRSQVFAPVDRLILRFLQEAHEWIRGHLRAPGPSGSTRAARLLPEFSSRPRVSLPFEPSSTRL